MKLCSFDSRHLRLACCALGLAWHLGAQGAQPSEASAALSLLPVASVLVAGSVLSDSTAASGQASAALATGAGKLVLRAVTASANGTTYLLERLSDGMRFSVQTTGAALKGSAVVAGTVVEVSVIGAGLILSVAGEVLALVPNALGQALLHSEKVTP